MTWQQGLFIYAAGYATSLLGCLAMALKRRGGGLLVAIGTAAGLAGAGIVLVARSHAGGTSFIVAVLVVVTGIVASVLSCTALASAAEHLGAIALFPLRRRVYQPMLSAPLGRQGRTVRRRSGVREVRRWEDRTFLVTDTIESHHKDGYHAEHGYVFTKGVLPAVGERVPECGRIERVVELQPGWWYIATHPHPDWPNARGETSPDWSV